MIKAILFDMDGVLLDSEWIYLHSLKKLLNKMNVDADINELAVVVGMKMEAISNYLIQHYSLSCSIKELSDDQDAAFDEEVEASALTPMEGLLDFLNLLKQNHLKIALASSSEISWITQVLDTLQISEYFDLIVSGDMVTHSKPHPEIFLKASELLGFKVNECLVIEDSVNGICAGKAAGMKVIGFKGSKIIQDTSNADIEVYSFKELLKL